MSAYDSAIPGSPLKATADLALKLYWGQYALNLLWTPVSLPQSDRRAPR